MKVRCIIFGVGSLLAIGLAQAGPPFVTDDPEPPPPGGWEINVPFIVERTPGKTDMDAPLFDLNYGLPDIEGFVREADRRIREQVKMPNGYLVEFGGQFQHLQEARTRLAIVVP